jgi:phosphoribosylformylglycinamidine synthase
VSFFVIGTTNLSSKISIRVSSPGQKDEVILDASIPQLRDIWNETSYHLELLQANPICVQQEQASLGHRTGMSFTVTFPLQQSVARNLSSNLPRIAILREEGSNGDREMSSAFHIAGFEVWDIVMSDLVNKKVSLGDDTFSGIAFVGGFSYADVMDSAKGWAGVAKFNKHIWLQLENFYNRFTGNFTVLTRTERTPLVLGFATVVS